MKESTKQMLEALRDFSTNESCQAIAERILSGKTTVEDEKKYCGEFMQAVLDGDFWEAFQRADHLNTIALSILITNFKRPNQYGYNN